MLEGGADIRFIQALLGHESRETTQIHTHVAIGKLAGIHAATHPGTRLKPRNGGPHEHEDATLSGRVYQRRNPLADDEPAPEKEDVLEVIEVEDDEDIAANNDDHQARVRFIDGAANGQSRQPYYRRPQNSP